MNPASNYRRLWWRLAALFFVVGGALCFVAGQPNDPGPFSHLCVLGIVLAVIGVGIRIKKGGRRKD
jgi:hypothetical protein